MKRAKNVVSIPNFQKKMQVGLGEAIKRINLLHTKLRSGIASKNEETEHDLLMEALNEIKIDLGFDCDEDGIPDTIEVFTRTAKTSCCRLVSLDEPPKKRKTRKTRSRK